MPLWPLSREHRRLLTLSINTNVAASNVERLQARTQSELSTSIARLSSGLRINGARDDAAGLAIAERFTSQMRGAGQAARNANEGISLAQTGEAALASIAGNLQRMRELAVQAANDTNSPSDRAASQLEVAQLLNEIDRVATQSEFNGRKLLDGTLQMQSFQLGANRGQSVALPSINNASGQVLGKYAGTSVTAQVIGNTGALTGAFSVSLGGGPPLFIGTLPNDAKVLAAAINGSGIQGLSAKAGVTVMNGDYFSSATTTGLAGYTVNGATVHFIGVPGDANGNMDRAVAAINTVSDATGAVATRDFANNSVRVEAADGRNLDITYSAGSYTGSTELDFGLDAGYIKGADLTVNYDSPAGTVTSLDCIHAVAFGYNHSGVYVDRGTAIAGATVASASGAKAAIASIDIALNQVNNQRAVLGSVQNRFSAAVAALGNATDNLSAARSRVRDADFAQETASLSRSQILQQAGTAMMAQANQLPGQVLALLR